MNDQFVDHLSFELQQLYDRFDKKWPKYKDSWKDMPFHALVQRLLSEHPENKGELIELIEAIENVSNDSNTWENIRHESLDSIMVLFFIVQCCNAKLGDYHGWRHDGAWTPEKSKWNTEPYESFHRRFGHV